MTPRDRLLVISPEEDVAEALNQMMQHDYRQVPVVRDGQLLGLLRRSDIIRWLQLSSDGKGREEAVPRS